MTSELQFPKSAGDRYAARSYSLISGDHRTVDPIQLGPGFCRRSIATSSRGGRAASFNAGELASSTIHPASYVHTTADRVVPLTAQLEMVSDTGGVAAARRLPSSHMAMLSNPEGLAAVLLDLTA